CASRSGVVWAETVPKGRPCARYSQGPLDVRALPGFVGGAGLAVPPRSRLGSIYWFIYSVDADHCSHSSAGFADRGCPTAEARNASKGCELANFLFHSR